MDDSSIPCGPTRTPRFKADDEVGGRYRLVSLLGSGGQAKADQGGGVWKAMDLDDYSRLVAIKLLVDPDDESRKRLKEEYNICHKTELAEAVVARALAFGDQALPSCKVAFLVSELVTSVDGGPPPTLVAYADRQRLSICDRIELFCKVCDGVILIHKHDIAHRDLKPDNILVDRTGQPRLVDFGIALDEQRRNRATALNTQIKASGGGHVGTPGYQPPEARLQTRPGTNMNYRAFDIYALGVLLYELLVGVGPWIDEAPGGRERIPCERSPEGYQLHPSLRYVLALGSSSEPAHREALSARHCDSVDELLSAFRTPHDPVQERDTFLDAIAILATHGNRDHRYASVSRLLEDLKLWLHGQPPSGNTGRVQRVPLPGWLRRLPQSNEDANTYSSLLQGAGALIREKRLASARTLLEQAKSLGGGSLARHWEWGYLKRATQPWRHQLKTGSSRVTDAVFSPNGKQIATASDDGAVNVWDAPTRQQTPCKGHEAVAYGVTFSPDSKRIATLSTDRTGRLWHAATGVPIAKLSMDGSRILLAAFSPDGSRLATASLSGETWIWDGTSGQHQRVLCRSDRRPSALAFAPVGDGVLTASADGFVRILDTTTGTCLEEYGPLGKVDFAGFSPDGKRVLASAESSASVWDRTSRREVTLRGHRGPIVDACFSADGRHIATASLDWNAIVWDASDGRLMYEIKYHMRGVRLVAFSPDSQKLLTGARDGAVIVWDVLAGRLLHDLCGHSAPVCSARFSPDGSQVITAARDGAAQLWDLADRQPLIDQKRLGGTACHLEFSPKGDKFVTILRGPGGKATIWDCVSGMMLRELHGCDVKGRLLSATFTPYGSHIVTTSDDGTARMWDVETGLLSGVVRHGAPVSSAEFSPNGSLLLTASLDGTARIWPAGGGEPLLTLTCDKPVNMATFNSQGSHILTIVGDGLVQVWAVGSNEMTPSDTHPELEGAVYSACFSPDGKQILTACADRKVRMWHVASGEFMEFVGHTDAVGSACFNRDGTRVLSTAVDGTSRVWDAETGDELATLFEGISACPAVFSPDGSTILHCCENRGIYLCHSDTAPSAESRSIVVKRTEGVDIDSTYEWSGTDLQPDSESSFTTESESQIKSSSCIEQDRASDTLDE